MILQIIFLKNEEISTLYIYIYIYRYILHTSVLRAPSTNLSVGARLNMDETCSPSVIRFVRLSLKFSPKIPGLKDPGVNIFQDNPPGGE